jgi:excisionase family DNA binding protein
MDPAPKFLYSRKEAAVSLAISLRSLDYLIGRGEIRVIRKSRHVMIHRSELERWAKIDNPRPICRPVRNASAPDSEQLRLGLREKAVMYVERQKDAPPSASHERRDGAHHSGPRRTAPPIDPGRDQISPR